MVGNADRNRGSVMGGYFSTSSSSVNSAVKMAVSKEVEDMIKSDKVVIFSKSYCPYCKIAKDVFIKLKQKVTVFELDQRDDGASIQEVLGDITGAKSVPRVFVDGTFIGGGTDVEKMMKSGSLQPLLAG